VLDLLGFSAKCGAGPPSSIARFGKDLRPLSSSLEVFFGACRRPIWSAFSATPMQGVGQSEDGYPANRRQTYFVGINSRLMPLEAAIIYPSLSLTWETECEDADYAQAMTRAYNRWVVDWCADSGNRLVPVAHLSLGDPKAAAEELERAVKGGHKGGFVVQFCCAVHDEPQAPCASGQ
jgi:hypothetical protein